MARKGRTPIREVIPDPKYGEIVIAKTVNVLMRHGKKSVAERAVYSALNAIHAKTGQEALEVFHRALENVQPILEVRSRRVGGATYQVPTEVSPRRGQCLAIRWLVESANQRTERKLSDRIAGELLDAFNRRGIAVKKREETHKMAEANKAFAHFRW